MLSDAAQAGAKYQAEGHTDLSGSAAYNHGLLGGRCGGCRGHASAGGSPRVLVDSGLRSKGHLEKSVAIRSKVRFGGPWNYHPLFGENSGLSYAIRYRCPPPMVSAPIAALRRKSGTWAWTTTKGFVPEALLPVLAGHLRSGSSIPRRIPLAPVVGVRRPQESVANAVAEDLRGGSASRYLSWNLDPAIGTLLVESGVNANVRDAGQSTPLTHASLNRRKAVVPSRLDPCPDSDLVPNPPDMDVAWLGLAHSMTSTAGAPASHGSAAVLIWPHASLGHVVSAGKCGVASGNQLIERQAVSIKEGAAHLPHPRNSRAWRDLFKEEES